MNSEGNIFVVDCWNHCIQKFTAEGGFLATVGSEGKSGPLRFQKPKGIAFNASNDRLYVVNGNGCIQILNSDLSYFGTFGKHGSGKGQCDTPLYIACDSMGNVYVADSENNRIQVFTAEGKFLRMFWRHRGEIWSPCGVAVDSSDRVYVSGYYNNRISVFTSEGQFVTSFYAKGEGTLAHGGLAVDKCGTVYVCYYNYGCIQLY